MIAHDSKRARYWDGRVSQTRINVPQSLFFLSAVFPLALSWFNRLPGRKNYRQSWNMSLLSAAASPVPRSVYKMGQVRGRLVHLFIEQILEIFVELLMTCQTLSWHEERKEGGRKRLREGRKTDKWGILPKVLPREVWSPSYYFSYGTITSFTSCFSGTFPGPSVQVGGCPKHGG